MLYQFKCKKCSFLQEEFAKEPMNLSEREVWANKEAIKCEKCSNIDWKSVFSSFHLDSSSQTHRDGIHGYFSAALGRHVPSKKAEQKIMAKKGFVCEADMPEHFWDDKAESINKKNAKQDAAIANYTDVLEKGGTKEAAVEALAPTKEILNGTTDKIWSK
tara:strand:- start:992 stop:1471 length:480 start_codon:yes stop_codon:yes gene_type:complete